MILKFQQYRVSLDSEKHRDPLAIAIEMLLRAYRFAKESRMDPWQYALEIEEFRSAGVSISELRLLVFTGMVCHAQELVDHNDDARRFMLLPKNSIPAGTCFVLSSQGANTLHRESRNDQTQFTPTVKVIARADPPTLDLNGTPPQVAIPIWIASKRELLFDGHLVKKFRLPAPNQEKILNAFQEENWVEHIDDPLPPSAEQDSGRKLRDSIKYLNGHQENRLIRFRCDGKGKGVIWEAIH